MFHCIIEAKPRANMRLWLKYDDGLAGEIDFAPLAAQGGVYERLADSSCFAACRIGDGGRSLEWPGEVDFCADALRKHLSAANDGATTPLPLMDALKEATKEAHDRTEQHALMGAMMQSPLDLAVYRAVLRCFLSFVRPLEARMNAEVDWAALGLDHEARHKTPWLEHDLAILGEDPAQAADAPETPSPTGLAEAFGCRYVLEGSTLGGQYIVKHLRKELPSEVREAIAYFDGYGSETGSKWKAFRAFGNGLITSPADIQAACTAANETFEALGAVMARAERESG